MSDLTPRRMSDHHDDWFTDALIRAGLKPEFKWVKVQMNVLVGSVNTVIDNIEILVTEGEPVGCFCDADTLEAEGKYHQQMTHGEPT